jgi:hypothetical protein
MTSHPQPQTYPQPVPPKKSLSTIIALIIIGLVFGSCALCGVLGGIGSLLNPNKPTASPTQIASASNQPVQSSATPQSSGEAANKPTNSSEPKKNTADDIQKYRTLMKSFDKGENVITNVTQGRVDGEIKITVSNAWHYEPYQVRLQLAQNLWKAWAAIHSPDEPDKSRIQIVDLNDNEVGGSRIWAGSLIWVQE